MTTIPFRDSKFDKKISEQVELEFNRYPSAKFIIENNSTKVTDEMILIPKSAILDALVSVEMEISKAIMTGTMDDLYLFPTN